MSYLGKKAAAREAVSAGTVVIGISLVMVVVAVAIAAAAFVAVALIVYVVARVLVAWVRRIRRRAHKGPGGVAIRRAQRAGAITTRSRSGTVSPPVGASSSPSSGGRLLGLPATVDQLSDGSVTRMEATDAGGDTPSTIDVFLRPDGQWARKKRGAKRTGSVHPTLLEAREAAMSQASRERIRVVVHDEGGGVIETVLPGQ